MSFSVQSEAERGNGELRLTVDQNACPRPPPAAAAGAADADVAAAAAAAAADAEWPWSPAAHVVQLFWAGEADGAVDDEGRAPASPAAALPLGSLLDSELWPLYT